MKSLKIIALTAVLTLAGLSAMAAEDSHKKPYLGFDANIQNFDNGSDSLNPAAVTFKGGAFFHQYVAAEARLGFGVATDSVGGMDVMTDYYAGAYVRLAAQMDKLSPYLIGGFTAAKASYSGGGVSESINKSGLSYGAGLDYKFGEHYAATVEWMKLVDKSDFDLSSINVGVKYLF